MKISRNRFLAFCLMTSTALTINFVNYTYGMESTSGPQQSGQFSPEEVSRQADAFLNALERDNPDVKIDRDKLKKSIQSGHLTIKGVMELPPEIGDLLNLRALVIEDNSQAKLLPEIGNLVNLEKLTISFSKFTELPPEIGNLMNLTELKISAPLTSLSSEIGKLVNLKFFNLYGSKLTNLPPEIGRLRNLENLLLSNNRFISLPPEIGNLTKLNKLGLRRNDLTALPEGIGNLKALQTLMVDGNQLTELPASIGELKALTTLDLEYNQLTALPNNIGRCVNLQYIKLNDNQFMELPSGVQNLNNLIILDLLGNSILPRGNSEQTWGGEELQRHFGNRVVLSLINMQSMSSDTTLEQVQKTLDKNPLRINREILKEIRIPDLPGETIENAEEFMELFGYLITNLNFSHEDQPGYLSYELLAGDYAIEAQNDHHASNTDKIFKYLLPRLTGYFKVLYGMPVDEGESRGWQMYEENKPALKKALSFILRSMNALEDPEQRSLLFVTFLDGMLHCPTGQKEGIDTVVLSLLGGKTTSSDWRYILTTHVALKKNLHFKTAILAKGANSGQNVHLISTYEGRLRGLLGLSNILGYREKMGIFGQDPFKNNPYNVYQVYFHLLPVQRLVDWAIEKIQTTPDRELQVQLAELVMKEHQGKQAGSINAANPALLRRLEALKAQIAEPQVPEANKPALATQIGQLEAMLHRSAGSTIGQSSSLNEEEKRELSTKILELRSKVRTSQEFHPISNEMIIGYLKEEMGGQLQEGWWQGYFSADPAISSLAAPTREGVLKLLTQLGYVIDERNKG